MTERDALYRAILQHPDDDTPRLVFADYLDENGEADRASFIRTQVELARIKATIRCIDPRHTPSESGYLGCGDWVFVAESYLLLRSRERDLFNAHGAEWFGANIALDPPEQWAYRTPHDVALRIARGFPAHWYGPWSAWVGWSCASCDGSGYVQYSDPNSVPVGGNRCVVCKGSGRIPGACETIAWRPTWEMECGWCDGRGEERYCDAAGDMDDRPCEDCGGGYQNGYRRGSGRTPRPCPPGAVPLMNVTLTTMPDEIEWLTLRWPGLRFHLPSERQDNRRDPVADAYLSGRPAIIDPRAFINPRNI